MNKSDGEQGQIIALAKHESEFLRHYYLGVEHIFIALTKIKNGLTEKILNQLKFNKKQIIDGIYREMEEGDKQNYWSEMPFTPRCKTILDLAEKEAKKENTKVGEKHLLLAILMEGNSVPCRIFQNLNVSIPQMIKIVEKEQDKPLEKQIPVEKPVQLGFSSGILLSWQIATGEAIYLQHQFVEIEHVFIGMCKASDFLSIEMLQEMKIDTADLDMMTIEFDNLSDLLSEFDFDRMDIRRKVREQLKPGNSKHTKQIIHRSEHCKDVFNQAAQTATDYHSQTIGVLHLLHVILHDDNLVVKVLQESNVNIYKLRDTLTKKLEGKTVASKTPTLDRYGRDLTYQARQGKISQIIGRKQEMLEVVQTIIRKKKNNPILIGDAGVGKTAVVEGLALRIASSNILKDLQEKRIIELNTASIVADTKYRGDFEKRFLQIINEAKNPNIILFIDEIHTLVGAGRTDGALDASNILKPALARGEIKCIGATTTSEYRKYIEKDSALERRFQPIKIEEPSVKDAITILEGLKESYEKHHHVEITPSAIDSAVKLSARYLPDRRLPDKALDLLDEACSRKKVPVLSVFDEKDFDQPVPQITDEEIASVLASWTGIPVNKLKAAERDRLLMMEEIIKKRVIGQNEAVEKVCKRIRMSRAGLLDQNRPIGIFLFLGPTGVGKTELAKALSAFLFDSEKSLIRIDMSEYMEQHSVSKLIGAPPGYVGYEEEGQLTGAIRQHPHSIVLLDEIEKAHQKVFDIFLQLFDEGRLTDAKGKTVDATNVIFIMTSNIGSDLYFQVPEYRFLYGGDVNQNQTDIRQKIISHVHGSFRPEFINRIDEITIFKPLSKKDMHKITIINIEKLIQRIKEKDITLKVEDEAIDLLCEKGYDPVNGARPLRKIIERLVMDPLSNGILKQDFKKGDTIDIVKNQDNIELKKENNNLEAS